MKKTIYLIVVLAFLGCKKEAKEEGDQDFSTQPAPARTELMKKADNFFKSISTVTYSDVPQGESVASYANTPEDKIDLGKKLFYDKALSKGGTISCNSCHNLNTFGVDNKPLSLGSGTRNTPTVINASLQKMFFWDGTAKDVEEVAGKHLLNPKIFGIAGKEALEKKLKGMPEYVTLFKKAYPADTQPITFGNITNAIGTFEKQLTSKSKFDEYLDGNDAALTDQEKAGLEGFIDTGCITCHTSVAVGGTTYQKLGVYGDYATFTKSKKIDNGLYEVTKKDADKFMFKVPGLRNVEKTSPYFHDGSVTTLPEVIKIMGKMQLNKDLNDAQIANIEAFLKTLTADVDTKYKQ